MLDHFSADIEHIEAAAEILQHREGALLQRTVLSPVQQLGQGDNRDRQVRRILVEAIQQRLWLPKAAIVHGAAERQSSQDAQSLIHRIIDAPLGTSGVPPKRRTHR